MSIHKTEVLARVMTTYMPLMVELLKPHILNDKQDANELNNFFWHMKRYFKAITLVDEATKVHIASSTSLILLLYGGVRGSLTWQKTFSP